jgi:hypothetical protein
MLSYFHFFHPDLLDRPIKPKTEEPEPPVEAVNAANKRAADTKAFLTYIFKKSTRIKNLVYLAYKFP